MKSFLDVRKNSETQELKFDRLVLVGEYNFDYSNGLVTSLTLDVPKQYLNANYMLVEDTTGQNTFYYFITGYNISCVTETSVTAKFNLECDVIATYGKSFMEGVIDKPLFTERKHSQRFSKTENAFECCDLSLSEDVTINCKPSVVREVYDYKLKDMPSKSPLWVYLYKLEVGDSSVANISSLTYIYAFPMVDIFRYKVPSKTSPNTLTLYECNPNDILSFAYDDTNTASIRFSPFPPFSTLQNANIQTFEENGKEVFEITIGNVEWYESDTGSKPKFNIGENVFTSGLIKINHTDLVLTTDQFTLLLVEQKELEYTLENIDNKSFLPIITKPTLMTNKSISLEPKLLFSPCTKYDIYQRSGKPYEFYPELVVISQPLRNVYEIKSYTSFSLMNNVTSTFVKIGGDYNTTWENDKLNYGLVVSENYNFPSGSNALKNFKDTQLTQYATNTSLKAIGGILGGISSIKNPIIAGAGIVTGVGAIASAISKNIDLKNTPNQLSNSGNNVFQDIVYTYGNSYNDGGLLPKIVVTELTKSEQEMLLDYFYHNGYNTQRMCYFKTSLDYEDIIDNRLLTRTNFNYVKLNDNFRYHLTGSDIPPVVIDKLTNIFNNGITLWTLFNFGNIRLIGEFDTWENDVAPYFMKDTYENIEIDM